MFKFIKNILGTTKRDKHINSIIKDLDRLKEDNNRLKRRIANLEAQSTLGVAIATITETDIYIISTFKQQYNINRICLEEDSFLPIQIIRSDLVSPRTPKSLSPPVLQINQQL